MTYIPASKRGRQDYADISRFAGGSNFGVWQNYPTAPPSKSLEFDFSGLEPPSLDQTVVENLRVEIIEATKIDEESIRQNRVESRSDTCFISQYEHRSYAKGRGIQEGHGGGGPCVNRNRQYITPTYYQTARNITDVA